MQEVNKIMFAYTGKILHIDLSNQTTRIQWADEDFLKKYVGGVGLATRLVYDFPLLTLTFASCSSVVPYFSMCARANIA
ncbi:MAG: aldehyde ferredoxin oxidoreductase N-terminal domain-containing protein [Candidatus Bathyarchaeia archaeon]